MGLRRTKLDENVAIIFIPIRVSSYPCYLHPWLFSQDYQMLLWPLWALSLMSVGALFMGRHETGPDKDLP
jgi:hypothetical protein